MIDRQRRSLTHVGGAIETAGDAADAARLAHALEVSPAGDADDDPARGHVHGFHTYPARLHPETAGRLIAAFAPPGGTVLDPFCGSGTVLVEAALRGHPAVGTDLNPLAVLLARCKSHPRTPAELEHLRQRAAECAAHADTRRRTRAGATRRFPDEDVALFEPHVLLELDSLRAALEGLKNDPAQHDLWLLLSALLVKFSRKVADTSVGVGVRRTRAGAVAKLFVEKTDELARRLVAFSERLPKPVPAVRVAVDDATVLRSIRPSSVDVVVTSPPYAGTYDYLEHHALRLRWLGLDASPLAKGELGSRSAYRRLTPQAARTTWSSELAKVLTSLSRVLRPGGCVVLVMADSAVGRVALRADEIVAETARACGFLPAARASQPRPHFHGPTADAFRQRPRAEHAILLRSEKPRSKLPGSTIPAFPRRGG